MGVRVGVGVGVSRRSEKPCLSEAESVLPEVKEFPTGKNWRKSSMLRK